LVTDEKTFMTTIKAITQPLFENTLNAVDGGLAIPGLSTIFVAAAYITTGGVRVLLEKMRERGCANDPQVVKRWITSFDYCRTDPTALRALQKLSGASVKIHDAQNCLDHKGIPRVPFHPKTFLFRGSQLDYVLTGSGNISRSGLCGGYEAGLVIGADRTAMANACPARFAIDSLHRYFDAIWNSADTLTHLLLDRYEALFESEENLKNPVSTEDDTAPSESSKGTLASEDLKKLRVCRHFWIDAGNITKNRGRNLPGNQLMMKRLSRVFFGFEPISVHENSPIGSVAVHYSTSVRRDCSLTYSDNKMDKLVLPIPGDGGPQFYDNQILLFERIDPGSFELTVGTQTEVNTWKRKSQRINASFTMTGGREWGVF
jgi:hypothetical protein